MNHLFITIIREEMKYDTCRVSVIQATAAKQATGRKNIESL